VTNWNAAQLQADNEFDFNENFRGLNAIGRAIAQNHHWLSWSITNLTENTRRESENTEGNFLFDTIILPCFPQKINPGMYIF
jgi:hypothetical protein